MNAGKAKKTKRHYDEEALLEDYEQTFGISMKATIYGIGGVLIFFLLFIVYLGAFSHTKHKPKYDTFKDRFTIQYEGKKLPYYEK